MATKPTDPTNSQIGQAQVKEISTEGAAEVISDSGIEKVPGPGFKSVAEMEKFMQDELTLFVYEPMEEGEEWIIQTFVNGVSQLITRGKEQKVKRKYVEVLARARRVNVSAAGYKDNAGEARNTVNISSGLQYPFQVLNDPSRNGPAWLKQILAEE